jgi:hypothetical protein
MSEDKARGICRSAPGAKHAECEYLVLDLTHDSLAWHALAAYQHAASLAGYHALAEDLRLKIAEHDAGIRL